MDAMITLGAKKIITNADLPESISWYKKNFGYKIIGKIKKINEFGNPVIDHWTTLELDVEEIGK
jgi:ribosomal-protein-alanine N-acetyltransferase